MDGQSSFGEAAGAGLAWCGRRGRKVASHAMGRRRARVLRAEAARDFVLGRRGVRVPRAEVAGAFVLGQRGRLRRVVAPRAEAADWAAHNCLHRGLKRSSSRAEAGCGNCELVFLTSLLSVEFVMG